MVIIVSVQAESRLLVTQWIQWFVCFSCWNFTKLVSQTLCKVITIVYPPILCRQLNVMGCCGESAVKLSEPQERIMVGFWGGGCMVQHFIPLNFDHLPQTSPYKIIITLTLEIYQTIIFTLSDTELICWKRKSLFEPKTK